jgi:hypothetical protein
VFLDVSIRTIHILRDQIRSDPGVFPRCGMPGFADARLHKHNAALGEIAAEDEYRCRPPRCREIWFAFQGGGKSVVGLWLFV